MQLTIKHKGHVDESHISCEEKENFDQTEFRGPYILGLGRKRQDTVIYLGERRCISIWM